MLRASPRALTRLPRAQWAGSQLPSLAPRLVPGFGCSVDISQLRRLIHLAVECNNIPGSQQRGRAWFLFKLESTSLWFWLSGQHTPPRLWPECRPPQQVSRGTRLVSPLISKLKFQREQEDRPRASIQLAAHSAREGGRADMLFADLVRRTNRGPPRLLPPAAACSRCAGDPWLTSLGWLRQNIPFPSTRFHHEGESFDQ